MFSTAANINGRRFLILREEDFTEHGMVEKSELYDLMALQKEVSDLKEMIEPSKLKDLAVKNSCLLNYTIL